MMNSTLKPFQKDRVKQFMAVTNSPEKSALKFLKETEWDVERAIDRFYSEGASVPKSAVNASKINALFDKYKEADEDEIQVDGTLALCSDLEVDPQDVVVLVLAWHLGCQRMGEFKRKGWVDGWTQLRYVLHSGAALQSPHSRCSSCIDATRLKQ
ncbi:hypothetical protein BJ742DRAFT_341044 [Cladochytrium replicatum]|nr:hypothetical protein BJ742DRAFT_341044 [Cladochytrium replicatum]